jgi:hypothetical protein
MKSVTLIICTTVTVLLLIWKVTDARLDYRVIGLCESRGGAVSYHNDELTCDMPKPPQTIVYQPYEVYGRVALKPEASKPKR